MWHWCFNCKIVFEGSDIRHSCGGHTSEIEWWNNLGDYSNRKNNDDKYVIVETEFIPYGFEVENGELSIDDYDFGDYSITDISEIYGLNKVLDIKKLVLYAHLYEMDWVKNFVNLEYLDLSYNNIIEVEGLENLVKLKELKLANNNITEINGLENLKDLDHLDLSGNKISVIKGLSNLENLKVFSLYNEKHPEILIAEAVLEEILGENAENMLKDVFYTLERQQMLGTLPKNNQGMMGSFNPPPPLLEEELNKIAKRFVSYCRENPQKQARKKN